MYTMFKHLQSIPHMWDILYRHDHAYSKSIPCYIMPILCVCGLVPDNPMGKFLCRGQEWKICIPCSEVWNLSSTTGSFFAEVTMHFAVIPMIYLGSMVCMWTGWGHSWGGVPLLALKVPDLYILFEGLETILYRGNYVFPSHSNTLYCQSSVYVNWLATIPGGGNSSAGPQSTRSVYHV